MLAATGFTVQDPVSQALSVLIPIIVAVSVWLAGNRNTWSWPLGITGHFITGVYAVVSHHWGWLIAPLVVAPVFVRNWLKWHREATTAAAGDVDADGEVKERR